MASSEENGPSLPPAQRPAHWLSPSESLTYVPVGPEIDEEPGVDLSAIVGMLWRRKWTIGLIGLAVLALAAGLTLRMPETYESTATVIVQERGRNNDSALEVLEGVGRTDVPLETEARLITSRRVIEPVVTELALHVSLEADRKGLRPQNGFTEFRAAPDAAPGSYRVVREGPDYAIRDAVVDTLIARSRRSQVDALAGVEFAGIQLGIAPDDEGIGGSLHVATLDNAVRGVRSRVRAARVGENANLVTISCVADRPDAAQELCSAVSTSYIRARSEMQRASAEEAAKFLVEQVEEVGDRLAAAEDSLGAYEERNQAVALQQRATAEVNQYAALGFDREQLEAERSALATLLREINQPGVEGRRYRDLATFPGFVKGANPVVSKLMQNLIELEDRRSQLAITRSDRNPDIVAVDARIEELEGQLRSFATSYERSLSKQVTSLESAMGRSQGQLSAIPAKQVASSRLQRQVDLLQELYRFLQTRLREAEVARNVDLPAVQIVDEASLPLGPSSPDVRTNLMLGLLLGLGLGTVVALYREYTDSRIRGRKEVERQTGIPVLGMIPSVKRPGPVLPVTNGGGRRAIGGGGAAALPGKRTSKEERKITNILRGKSWDEHLAFEAFRSLLMDMSSVGAADTGAKIRSVAVTSSTRGDGKTFTACNLAIASAAQGRRTLLIDTDLRARGVTRFFKLPWASPGLTEVLEGERDYQGLLNDLDIVGDHSSLHVLASGNPETSMGSILERRSGRLESLMRDMENSYDLVIVDTPPLNVITDAATIATRADAVLVVVRGGLTDRNALDLTLKRLRYLHTNVLGVVLNDVDLPAYYTSYSGAPDD